MESTVMETAISQGIWAVLAVFLLIYIVTVSYTHLTLPTILRV